MVKWMKWTLENVPKGGQTELSLSRKLEEFRAEQPLFMGLSFESIMGYAHHGAIVHYDPTPETDIPVKAEGLLLIDSGGQYLDGTTDADGRLTDAKNGINVRFSNGYDFPIRIEASCHDLCLFIAIYREDAAV